jgi:ribosome maturation factor RimP
VQFDRRGKEDGVGTAEEIEAVVIPVCATLGVRLFDVEQRGSVVQVTVERQDGLDLDALAEVSRALSSALDAAEDVTPAEPYELEVSSPGVERRLRTPEHFRGATGDRIALRTRPGTRGARRAEGVVVSVGDEGIVLEADGEERIVRFADIERAHTVFDWRAALAAPADLDGTRREPASTTTREKVTRS